MPHYYFDIFDGIDQRDDKGQDLQDVEEARREALNIVGRLIAEESEDTDGCTILVNVRDALGAVALTVRMVSQVEEPPVSPAPGSAEGTSAA